KLDAQERDGSQRESGMNPRSEPSRRELVLLFLLAAAVFVGTSAGLRGWRNLILNFGDNLAYLEVAIAIRRWDFHGLSIQHFMGYPYAVAAVSLLHVPGWAALWIIAGAASLISTMLIARLFGGWVAGYFAFTNFAWLQLSFLGGSETLAVALGMGAFWSFRRDRPFLAALLGALATTVRPLMFFVLVGIGIALLLKKRYAVFAGTLAIGLVIGLLYVAPLARYYGDPWLNVHSYTSTDYGAVRVSGPHGHLFGWPLHGIIVGTMIYPAPWTNLVLSFSWIAAVLAGTVSMFGADFRKYARANPGEVVFCGLYLLGIF